MFARTQSALHQAADERQVVVGLVAALRWHGFPEDSPKKKAGHRCRADLQVGSGAVLQRHLVGRGVSGIFCAYLSTSPPSTLTMMAEGRIAALMTTAERARFCPTSRCALTGAGAEVGAAQSTAAPLLPNKGIVGVCVETTKADLPP